MADEKADLLAYLVRARDALVWKTDGLSDYDVRRPMTRTGTNLLGLVKHVASVAVGYFGETFDRPFAEPLPWLADGAPPNADMYAAADESRADVLSFHDRAWAHSIATIEALDLGAIGRVRWWPADRNEVTLYRVLVHMVAEVDRHAGQADIVRELIDGAAGQRSDHGGLPEESARWWADYVGEVESAARAATGSRAGGLTG